MADSERSEHVTTTTTNSGGGAGMGFVVGILVVVVAGLAYLVLGGELGAGSGDVNVTIEGLGDAVKGAAETSGGASGSDSSS